MLIKIELKEAQLIPRGYGIAYRKYDCRITVCYPIPLNLLVRLWHNIINRMTYPKGIDKDDKLYWRLRQSILDELSAILHKKWEQGYLKGFSDCKMQIEEFASIQEKELSWWILNTTNKVQDIVTEMREHQKDKDD